MTKVNAQECLLVCEESLSVCSITTPLDPFVVLALFLVTGAQTITESPNADDVTMKRLFTLAMNHYDDLLGSERHLAETLNEALKQQEREYTQLHQLIQTNPTTGCSCHRHQ